MAFTLRMAATREDWLNLFRKVKGDELLRFYPTYTYSWDEISPQHLEDLKGLGLAKRGILVQEDSFLAVPATVQVVSQTIHQDDGTIRYSMTQLTNPDSFIFRPGGLWGSSYFIIGEVSSLYNTGIAAGIGKKMRGAIRRHFHVHEGSRVGPECYALYSDRTFTTDYRNSALK